MPGKVTSSSQPPIPVMTARNPIRKKIIKPFIPVTTVATTLPPIIDEAGALNRTEDDPRCELQKNLKDSEELVFSKLLTFGLTKSSFCF